MNRCLSFGVSGTAAASASEHMSRETGRVGEQQREDPILRHPLPAALEQVCRIGNVFENVEQGHDVEVAAEKCLRA